MLPFRLLICISEYKITENIADTFWTVLKDSTLKILPNYIFTYNLLQSQIVNGKLILCRKCDLYAKKKGRPYVCPFTVRNNRAWAFTSRLAPLPNTTIFVTSRKWSSTLIPCVLHDSTARLIATTKFSHRAYPKTWQPGLRFKVVKFDYFICILCDKCKEIIFACEINIRHEEEVKAALLLNNPPHVSLIFRKFLG